MQDKTQAFNMLKIIIKHFQKDPNALRSVDNNTTRGCFYNPPISRPKSIGCAIGMFIGYENAEKLDRAPYGSEITDIIDFEDTRKLLPKWMLMMDPYFLSDLQELHDLEKHWNSIGLTSLGIAKIKSICVQYKLSFQKMKVFIVNNLEEQ